MTIPSKEEGSKESPRDRVINYLYALDSLSFSEVTSLVFFVTSHSFHVVNLFFTHYYRGQWRAWNDDTSDSIEVREINGEELIWGKETKTVLVYQGTYKNRKYYGNGTLYVPLDNGGNAFDWYSPHEQGSVLLGHFEDGRMEGWFDYRNARGLVSWDFYIHGRKYGLQVSFFPSSRNSPTQHPSSKAIYRDNEENGEYHEFTANYYKRKGWKYNGEVDKDDTYIFEGPHICHKEGDSAKYFLSTPGMEDSLELYTFNDKYYYGDIKNLIKEGEPMRNFSNADGDWGHVGNKDLEA